MSPEAVWQEITGEFAAEACSRWWNIISCRYTESHRHYHNMTHITNMLNLCQEHRRLLRDYRLVCLATIFHDIVYDPNAQDNEEKSAALFQRFAKDVKLQEEKTQKAADWILATKTHCTLAHTSVTNPGVLDIHYLLDFDMAPLGAPLEEFLTNNADIRHEYSHLSEDQWRDGRVKFLRGLQKIPFIFATELFRDSHEEQAQSNIQYDISTLTQTPTNIG